MQSEAIAQGEEAAGARKGARRRAYFTLTMLMLAYACAYLDRSVISIVLPQIKAAFHVGDTGLGFLSGLAFAVVFVVFGLPLATLADRTNRRNVIAGAIAVWSVMTALCGLAGGFVQLVLARIGVGVGEAGLSPPANSIVADLFPEGRRATALAYYQTGIYLGVLLGLAFGGYLADRFGWRATFLFVAAPGAVVSILIALAVREPFRGAHDAHLENAQEEYRGYLRVIGFLWSTPTLRYTVIGITFCSLYTQTGGAWTPSFLVRVDRMPIREAGLILGLSSGVGGALGTMIGGRLSDYFGRRDPRWRLWLVTAAFLVLPATSLTFLYSRDTTVIIAMAAIGPMCAAMHLAPTAAVTQDLTPPRMRARAVAVTLFLITLIGGGLGPLVVGMLSDALVPAFGRQSLRYALTVLALFALCSAAIYFLAGLAMPRRSQDSRRA